MAVPPLACSSHTHKNAEEKDREMKFLRNVAGYTIKCRVRNTVIMNELNIFDLNNRIQNNRLNWINDVERLKPERVPKQ
jgi:hypothetical protein